MPEVISFEDAYKNLHAHPELSFQEERTAKIAAQHLRSFNVFTVYEHVGGYGVVGVCQSGNGPTVLLRADMDGLPVEEATGLPYSSNVKTRDADGNQVPVMAACGHDMHTTILTAAASTLATAKQHWRGTLICLFQPAEEFAAGARAMIQDGLYTACHKIPVPDIVLGQHVFMLKAGTVGLSSGPVFAAVDSLSIRIHGRGGHGTRPDLAVDPVLTAAHVAVRLQSIVTREVNPAETCVLTVESIVAGDAANVIPDYADIKLTLRSYDADVQSCVLRAVHRVAKAECVASCCEHDPAIKTLMHAPITVNDEKASERLSSAFQHHFKSSAVAQDRNPGSEDVGELGRAIDKPLVYWILGGVAPEVWDKAVSEGTMAQIPYNHSPRYAPVMQPTLSMGIDALALGALEFLASAA